jgi:hypothetical protein
MADDWRRCRIPAIKQVESVGVLGFQVALGILHNCSDLGRQLRTPKTLSDPPLLAPSLRQLDSYLKLSINCDILDHHTRFNMDLDGFDFSWSRKKELFRNIQLVKQNH